ncbi:acyl carrier protein [Kutzneria viridogrisea]
MAVDLRNRAVAAIGLDIPAMVIYDHPTLGAVAKYVDSLM